MCDQDKTKTMCFSVKTRCRDLKSLKEMQGLWAAAALQSAERPKPKQLDLSVLSGFAIKEHVQSRDIFKWGMEAEVYVILKMMQIAPGRRLFSSEWDNEGWHQDCPLSLWL